ncbi:hypothetical protein FJY94_01455 [Candidatus Kaiserbacteria bacterium]|nr:hypothetical protein [Candidatus Kaiserbacteria bacterium]
MDKFFFQAVELFVHRVVDGYGHEPELSETWLNSFGGLRSTPEEALADLETFRENPPSISGGPQPDGPIILRSSHGRTHKYARLRYYVRTLTREEAEDEGFTLP